MWTKVLQTIAIFTVLLLWCHAGPPASAYCPSDLYVTDVTSSSAVLHWRINGPRRIRSRIVDCEVKCSGVRHYTTADGTAMTNIDSVTHFVPRGQRHVLLGGLLPNFNYSCTVSAELNSGELATSNPYLFATGYKAPEVPQPPQINEKPGFEIQLFTTSSKFGPIHGYEVQFHVVDEETVYLDGVPDISGLLVTPNGPIATMEGSQMSPDPLSFRMTYASNDLPKQVKVGDDVQEGALKNGASYTVVTVAYTELTNDDGELLDNVLYSASRASRTFFIKGEKPVPITSQRFRDHPGKATLLIVLGTVIPMAVILYLFCVAMMIGIWQCKRRKYQDEVRDASKPDQDVGSSPTDRATGRPQTPKHSPSKKKPSSSKGTTAGNSSGQCAINMTCYMDDAPGPSGLTKCPSTTTMGSLYYYWDDVEQCTMAVPIDQCPWVAPNIDDSSSDSDSVASDYSDPDNSIFTTTPCTYVTYTGKTVVLVPLIPPPGFVEEAKRTPSLSLEEWEEAERKTKGKGVPGKPYLKKISKSDDDEKKVTKEDSGAWSREKVVEQVGFEGAGEQTTVKETEENIKEKSSGEQTTVEETEENIKEKSSGEQTTVEETEEDIKETSSGEQITVEENEEDIKETSSGEQTTVEETEEDIKETSSGEQTTVEESEEDIKEKSSGELQNERLSLQASSHVFLPRGMSSGPFQIQSPYAVRNFTAQLSRENSHLGDQAPELEMEVSFFGPGGVHGRKYLH